jgi:hypothetical protein
MSGPPNLDVPYSALLCTFLDPTGATPLFTTPRPASTLPVYCLPLPLPMPLPGPVRPRSALAFAPPNILPDPFAKMYRDYRSSRKAVIRMDPDCAICHAPASVACECEAKGLEYSIKQAEERMMKSIYSDIRKWVRAHAQDYILEYFRQLAERRKVNHAAVMERIHSQARFYYNAPPHPDQLADAQAALKRGIDEDWQASVARYPEVLEYFFGLVELTLPADDEPTVKEPPLGGAHRKANRRSGMPVPPAIPGGPGGHGGPGSLVAPLTGYHEREPMRPRTPSAPDRRTPAPGGRDRRSGGGYRPVLGNHGPPPGGQQQYYTHAPYLN